MTSSLAEGEAKAGKFKDWNGKLRDPRYFFKTETLRRWLGPLLVPELEDRLVAFGPPKTQEERQAAEKERLATFEKARKSRCRVQEGRYKTTRCKYLEESEARAQAARSLRECYIVSVRDLPEVTTDGETHPEALEHAGEAIAGVLLAKIDAGDEIALPSSLQKGEIAIALEVKTYPVLLTHRPLIT